MRLHLFIICLLTMGMTACHRSAPYSAKDDLEKEKFANNIIRKVATQLKQETVLQPSGTIGQMLRKVQVLGLSFRCYQPIDIVEGRKLLLKAVNTMMDEVNNDKRIHPYLSKNPFTPRNIEIQIFIKKPDGHDVDQNELSVVEASGGYLIYDIHHPSRPGFITIYKETYEEAVARLKDPSLPLVSFVPDPKIKSEALSKLYKSISFVGDDGVLWRLDENGCWVNKKP